MWVTSMHAHIKHPGRQIDNDILASVRVFFFFFETSPDCPPESEHVQTDAHSHSRQMSLTLSTSASLFLVSPHLPCYW